MEMEESSGKKGKDRAKKGKQTGSSAKGKGKRKNEESGHGFLSQANIEHCVYVCNADNNAGLAYVQFF
jgi:hypothetical protein